MSVLSLNDLCFSRPDGTAVFTGLSAVLPPGCTGLVGDNGSGKTTLLRLLAGELAPAGGGFRVEGRLSRLQQSADPDAPVAALFGKVAAMTRLRRAEAGRATEEDLALAEWDLEARLAAALARVGLAGVDPLLPMGRLSGGQRVRAALAAAFFEAPEVVLLDEPTNDLDADGRRLVADLLAAHCGVALVASHDRALLAQMDRILSLEAGQGRLVGGGWAAFVAERDAERRRAEQQLARAEQELRQTEEHIAEAARQKAVRARSGRKTRRSGSQGKMLMDAQRQRAENAGRGAARLAARQRNAAQQAFETAREAVPVQTTRRLEAVGTGQERALVLEIRDLRFGYPGGPVLIDGLSLTLAGGDRVAVGGANGSGKSTLLALAAGRLAPISGCVRTHGPVAVLDQQAAVLGQDGRLCDVFARVHPGLETNAIHAALARMGFRSDAGRRAVTQLSGGERVQAALALVLATPQPPALLILDEPTNHLDLAAIETVEAGLRDFTGTLLAVSHDETFLGNIGVTREIHLARNT